MVTDAFHQVGLLNIIDSTIPHSRRSLVDSAVVKDDKPFHYKQDNGYTNDYPGVRHPEGHPIGQPKAIKAVDNNPRAFVDLADVQNANANKYSPFHYKQDNVYLIDYSGALHAQGRPRELEERGHTHIYADASSYHDYSPFGQTDSFAVANGHVNIRRDILGSLIGAADPVAEGLGNAGSVSPGENTQSIRQGVSKSLLEAIAKRDEDPRRSRARSNTAKRDFSPDALVEGAVKSATAKSASGPQSETVPANAPEGVRNGYPGKVASKLGLRSLLDFIGNKIDTNADKYAPGLHQLTNGTTDDEPNAVADLRKALLQKKRSIIDTVFGTVSTVQDKAESLDQKKGPFGKRNILDNLFGLVQGLESKANALDGKKDNGFAGLTPSTPGVRRNVLDNVVGLVQGLETKTNTLDGKKDRGFAGLTPPTPAVDKRAVVDGVVGMIGDLTSESGGSALPIEMITGMTAPIRGALPVPIKREAGEEEKRDVAGSVVGTLTGAVSGLGVPVPGLGNAPAEKRNIGVVDKLLGTVTGLAGGVAGGSGGGGVGGGLAGGLLGKREDDTVV